jgi:hypothetical protein
MILDHELCVRLQLAMPRQPVNIIPPVSTFDLLTGEDGGDGGDDGDDGT